MTTNTQFEQELLDRTRRLETRMVQLGDHVGANLRTKMRIDVHLVDGVAVVNIDAMDVSLSRVVAELKAKAPGAHGPVHIYLGSVMAATVYV